MADSLARVENLLSDIDKIEHWKYGGVFYAHSGWDSRANAVKKPRQKWKRLSIPGTVIDPCTIWRHIGLLPYKGTILVYTTCKTKAE